MKLKLKDRIKINVLPLVAISLNKLGFKWETLGKSILDKSVQIAQASKLAKFGIDEQNSKQNIYFLTLLSGGKYMLFIESLLALGLKKRGHNIMFVIDDNTLPIHELRTNGNEKNWKYKGLVEFHYASKFLKKLKLSFVPISTFIEECKMDSYNKKYDYILEASLLRHYKVGVISNKLNLINDKKELLKQSITITNAIGEVLLNKKPDKVIMSHGIYSTWGPPFNILNENNIPILMYGRGKKRHTLKFDWNRTGDSWDVSEEWENVKNIDLTKKELKSINDYLESRISHKNDVFVYNFGKETSNNETIQYLGLDPKKPIYTLFTNVLWDAASAQREIAFKNPVEWVIETIAWFNDHPEKQLIVKIHPAEVVIGTNMPFYDIIMERIQPNSNVRIIKPDEKVNSWSIYEISYMGMVHTTTAGMELPLVNKPCLVVSKTHYRNKGFTIDINSKEEYFKILNEFDVARIDMVKNKKEALKYAHLLFIRYQIPFNMFYEEVSTNIKGFRKSTINDYLNYESYNYILDCIENNTPIFNN